MGRRWRVAVDPARIVPGARVELSAAEAHHAHRVLRLAPGECIAVFDGEGREWSAAVVVSTSEVVTVEIGEELETPVESPLAVTLFQGWCEPTRMEWVLQKGTEMGLAGLHPVVSGAPRAPSPNRIRRWQRIVAEACKQSGRRRLPALEPLDAFPSRPPSGTLAILLDLVPEAVPLDRLLVGAAPERVWLAVGPSGGLGEEASKTLAGGGWRRATLGPRTLRAETAGLAAGVILLHRWGDLGRDPDRRGEE